MKLEESITSAIRVAVLIGLGLVLFVGTVYAVGMKMAEWLEFSEREQRTAGAAAVLLGGLLAAGVGWMRLLAKSDGTEKTPQPNQEPPRRWSRELDVWYTGSVGVTAPFTGVVRTKNCAMHYLKAATRFPKHTAALLVPDESKFKFMNEMPRPPSRATKPGGHYLVELTNGKRQVCARYGSYWKSEDGAEDLYFDDEKQVVRYLLLSDEEANANG